MRKFEITEEQIKYLAQFGYAKDHLIKMFPAAFEPEWEEVPFTSFVVLRNSSLGIVFGEPEFTCSSVMPLMVCVRKGYEDDYKIEDGKIWRRKP